MKEKEIRVLKVEPGKQPVVAVLKNDLDSLQKAVSIGADYQGLIEILYAEENIMLLFNEEGKLIGLEPNRRYQGHIINGVFYVIGGDDEGEFVSLTEEELKRYSEIFHEPETFEEGEDGFMEVIGMFWSDAEW